MEGGAPSIAKHGARRWAGPGTQGAHADGTKAAGFALQRACGRTGREEEVRDFNDDDVYDSYRFASELSGVALLIMPSDLK